MKSLLTLILLLLVADQSRADEKDDIASVLDALHAAASRADAEAYFDLFADEAYFIGTDVGEYWSLEKFKSYTLPYFSRGQGWTYHPKDRDIHVSESGKVAWFHEVLESENYGTSRGTGVLLFDAEGGWRIAQYHLTFPIPNDLVDEVTDRIKAFEREDEL